MNTDLVERGWTDEHWNRITGAVTEEAQRARVAAQILPVVGPEDSSAVAFADFTLGDQANQTPPPRRRLTTNTLPGHLFTTIAVQVQLSSTEIADCELGAALVKFRRAANIVARLEDAVVFNDRTGQGPPRVGIAGIPAVYQVTGGGPPAGSTVELGLLPLDIGFGTITRIAPRQRLVVPGPFPQKPTLNQGKSLTRAIIRALNVLETAGQNGPFACALSPYFYEAIYTPSDNFVAARDRILPMLNGPIVRSSAIADVDLFGKASPYGVVIALGGSPVALRVASEISVRFLQVTAEPRYVFRVSERIGLRVTDPKALVVLTH